MSASLAGLVILVRHGDRLGFYQSPTTYTSSQTHLTILGYRQELFNGQDLRTRYLSSSLIAGLDPNLAQTDQINVQADAGGEGGVIVESALALLQGLYPAYNESITLANGTVVGWDNRAQLVPVETIEVDQEVNMEPWTNCDAWSNRLKRWYASSDFQARAKDAQAFYTSIRGLLDGRPATLENAWNVYDFLNVQRIHNATLAPSITDDVLEQAGTWANYHETGSFADKDPSNVGNVAGRGILPLIMEGVRAVGNESEALKIQVLAASYKPFLSLFKMLELGPLEDNLVDYATTLVFEVYDDQTLNVVFRNGSAGAFDSYGVLGATGRIAVAEVESKLGKYGLDTLAEWCDACGTTEARGCAPLYRLNGTGGGHEYASATSTYGHQRVSPVVAGVIGAVVALAVVAAAVGAWVYTTGGAVVVSRKRARREAAREGAKRAATARSWTRKGTSETGSAISRQASQDETIVGRDGDADAGGAGGEEDFELKRKAAGV
ncbi:hypothetical protein ACQY0O_005531 [Thecaphora frezii]